MINYQVHVDVFLLQYAVMRCPLIFDIHNSFIFWCLEPSQKSYMPCMSTLGLPNPLHMAPLVPLTPFCWILSPEGLAFYPRFVVWGVGCLNLAVLPSCLLGRMFCGSRRWIFAFPWRGPDEFASYVSQKSKSLKDFFLVIWGQLEEDAMIKQKTIIYPEVIGGILTHHYPWVQKKSRHPQTR